MFDSPFFWIALIWYLLSNVLGAKKRAAARKVQPEYEEDLIGDQWRDDAAEEPLVEAQPEVYEPPPPRAAQPTLRDMWKALEKEVTQKIEDAKQPYVVAEPVPEPVAVPVIEPVVRERVQPTTRVERNLSNLRDGEDAERAPAHRHEMQMPFLGRNHRAWSPLQLAVIYTEILGPPLALKRRGRVR